MPLNIDFQQILLHFFNFVILYAGLYFLLYKPVKAFMEKRANEYRLLDEQSRQSLRDAEELKEEYHNKLVNADEEIAEMKHNANVEIDKLRDESDEEARKEADRIIAEARRQAGYERDRIMKDAQRQITDIAYDAAERLLYGGEVGDAYDMFLDAAERSSADDGTEE